MNDAIHMKGLVLPEGTDPAAVCEVHAWPIEKLMTDLLPKMRERHGKGGLNVCVPCVERAKAEADRRRGRTSS